jgi:hypothetical protein
MNAIDDATNMDPAIKAKRQEGSAIDEQQADEEAVVRHVFDGKPLDPEVARRVQERGRRITEEIRRVHGVIDDATFQSLLDEDEA